MKIAMRDVVEKSTSREFLLTVELGDDFEIEV
jgi:hypothetical protein